MSVYMCNLVRGTIPDKAKQKIAADITGIHCALTGMDADLVHVFFFEDAPQVTLSGKSVFLFGNICGSRRLFAKGDLVKQIRQSVHRHTAVPMRALVVDTIEIPADRVLEGGVMASQSVQPA